MVTTKDIAKKAGVSRGTVSNVLNNKGNVSAVKITAVHKAAQELGYNLSRSASSLRLGKPTKIVVILPDTEVRRYRDFFKYFSQGLMNSTYEIQLYITDGEASKEKQTIIQTLSRDNYAYIIVTSLDKNDPFYSEQSFGETKLIFVERVIASHNNDSNFYGFNTKIIADEITTKIQEFQYKNILYFSDSLTYSFEEEIFNELFENFKTDKYSLKRYSSNVKTNMLKSIQILASNPDVDVIVTSNIERAFYINKIMKYLPGFDHVKMITIDNVSYIPHDSFLTIEIDYYDLANVVAKHILSDSIQNIYTSNKVSYTNLKLEMNEIMFKETVASKVTILCPTSPFSEAIRYLSPVIKTLTNIDIHVNEMDILTLEELVINHNIPSETDLLWCDYAWMKKSVIPILHPLDKISTNLTKKIYPSLLDVCTIDRILYALPIETNMQVLLYRNDFFENSRLKRLFLEYKNTELNIPNTIHELIELSTTINNTLKNEVQFKHTLATKPSQPLEIFDAFMAIYLSHEDNSIEPATRLSKSLEDYVVLYENFTKNETSGLTNFIEGNSILHFGKTQSIIEVVQKRSKIQGLFEVNTFKTNNLLSGAALGIYKNSNAIEKAQNVLEVLHSKKVVPLLSYLLGSTTSNFTFDNKELLAFYPWLELEKKIIQSNSFQIINLTLNDKLKFGTLLSKYFKNSIKLDVLIKELKNLII